MSTHLQEKQEKIQKILTALAEDSAKGTPIVVEGKKDLEALRSLDMNGPVLTIKTGGKSFVQAFREIEKTGAREVILLLDFDRRGREGTSRLKQSLEGLRIKPHIRFWRDLYALVGREIQCVESLTSYLETLQRKAM